MAAKDHVAVRLDTPTLERLDVLREVLSTDWHEANQSDVLRAVIFSNGLKSLEKEHAHRIAEVKKRRDGEKAPPAPEKAPAPEKPKRTRKAKG